MRPRKYDKLLMTLAILTACVAAPARAREVRAKVKYLSAEHIYLDAGALDGLAVGMRGEARQDGQVVVVLEVVYTADHSSACRVQGKGTVKEGDEVVFSDVAEAGTPPGEDDSASSDSTGRRRSTPEVVHRAVAPRAAPGAILSGSVGLTWDHYASGSDLALKTDYWALPFRFKVENLGRGFTLQSRGSVRRFERSGYTGSTPSGEWRSRIREIALVKDAEGAPWHLALGRVRSRATGAAGPFDGMLVERRLGGATYWGVFGGFTPEWGDYAFGTHDHLAGMTLHSRTRTESGLFADAMVTALGRYRGGEISREYLSWTVSVRGPSGYYLTHAADVDYNRGWRKDAAGGKSLALTGLALNGGIPVSRKIRLDAGYDDRELVRTWETRSLPDSLFRDSGRKGYRLGTSIRMGRQARLRLSGSVRKDDDESSNTVSWMGRFFQPRLGGHPVSLNITVRGFDGPYLKGLAPQGGLTLNNAGNRFSLGGGGYSYEGPAGTDKRGNTWASLGWSREFGRAWSSAAEYRRDWGDDIVGNRVTMEIHHRF